MKKIVLLLIFISFQTSHTQWELCSNKLDGGWISFLESRDSIVYAGIQGDGIFRSTDYGNLWTKKIKGLTNTFVNSLAISGNNIIAGSTYVGSGGSIFLSTDNCNTWSIKDTGIQGSNIQSLTIKGNVMLAGSNQGLFSSADSGNTWTKNNKLQSDINVSIVAVSGKVIHAVTNNGVYYSKDDGKTWIRNSYYFEYITVNCLLPVNNLIFAGTDDGIFQSTDNGINWTQKKISGNIHSLAVLGKNIFAGTRTGVYLYTDNGVSYTIKNIGLSNILINSLVISGEYILAGTDDGLFRAKLSDLIISDVPVTKQTTPDFQIFPNPALDFIEISDINLITNQNINIYNLLGECVIFLFPVPNTNKIDISALTTGVYYLKIGNEIKMFVKE